MRSGRGPGPGRGDGGLTATHTPVRTGTDRPRTGVSSCAGFAIATGPRRTPAATTGAGLACARP
ncbi:hypothetical protein Ae406Ps2_4789c [Pseudonocardia sp. Ae406_Ps2]|nr:hypothetical protein Ae406Ps2_4789c [Pseudonocardia sp. Ae406_Ps2]